MENPELPHLDRFIDNNEADILELREWQKSYGESIAEYRVESITSEEEELLKVSREAVWDFLKSYVPEEKLGKKDLPSDRVYVIEKDSLEKITNGEFHNAAYSPRIHSIALERQESALQFAALAIHEFAHSYAHHALQKDEDNKTIEYREGIEITSRDGIEKFFLDLNEGLVQYISRHLYQELFLPDPKYKTERERIDADNLHIFLGDERVWGYFNGVVDSIYDAKQEEFPNRQAVIDVFIKAAYQGTTLPVIRLISSVYGKENLRVKAKSSFYES